MSMKRAMATICAVILAGLGVLTGQTWTPLTNQPTFSASTAFILPDGRVLVQDTGAQDWWALTPDSSGSYQHGTWAQMATMPAGYSPLYYASAIIPDGRLVMLGGEYNFGTAVWTTLGAIYSPKTNKWVKLAAPSGWTSVGDAQSVVLANGTMMVANCCTTDEALFNATLRTWTATGTGKADVNDEEGWTLLPNGEVLTVDANLGNTNSEIYNPATGAWTTAGSTIVQLEDPGSHELGPAVLRPDGTVLATGATGHNAIYNSTTGVWSKAPDFPKNGAGAQLDIADGPAALLPDGNVLCMTSPGVFKAGVQFFEWDGTNFNAAPNTPNAPSDTSYYGRMLVLPTGQILLTDGSTDVELYTPAGGANPAWAPVITTVPKTETHGKTYTLKGTQLTGLSQGAAYGDDAQSASNYPLVRITNDASGRVFYARTHNFSSGVATGAASQVTKFDVPIAIDLGPSQLEVVTNGIASSPVSVTIN